MKKLIICLIAFLFFNSVFGQDGITISYTRPSKLSGSAVKIYITFDEQEISLKNGGSTSINLPLNSPRVIEIKVKAQVYKANYSLHAIPGENYSFEVGFGLRGVYIKLISGKEDLVATSRVAEDSNYDWKSSYKTSKDGSVGLQAEKVHSSEAIRQEWLRKGGKVNYTSVSFIGTYFRTDIENYGILDGYGGGLSYFTNHLNLKIPEYKPGLTSWNSYNWGGGFDFLIYSMKYGIDEELFRMDMNTLTMNMLFTLDLGWTLGVGKFKSVEQWRGVAFILKYRPAISLVMGSSTVSIEYTSPDIPSSTMASSIDPTFNFNFGGFGFDFQFSNFYATMDKLAPVPTMKLTAFILPPIGDSPLFISFGLGVLMYNK
ncbi:MAG: hypothetical protein CVT98_08185 [Bacteroidetes bacterium HGW-Bacteroidetes-15]|nr:MAG: hypothetical protein CVT98_08185 [Bacteroidetes bacterium HGW-Bacteroidetes-15]